MTSLIAALGAVALAVWGIVVGRRFGRTVETLEARLEPTADAPAGLRVLAGAKRRRYETGYEFLRVHCAVLPREDGPPPAGRDVEIVLDGEVVGTATMRKERLDWLRRSWKGEVVPPASVGSTVELRHEGRTWAEGRMKLDRIRGQHRSATP